MHTQETCESKHSRTHEVFDRELTRHDRRPFAYEKLAAQRRHSDKYSEGYAHNLHGEWQAPYSADERTRSSRLCR
jgi:hypothetical protein